MSKLDLNILKNPECCELRYLGLRSRGWCVVFRGKKFFLKERYGKEFKEESRWLTYLTKAGFPHAPHFYGTLHYQGAHFLVQDFIDGEEIGRTGVMDAGTVQRLAKILAQLHLLKRETRKKSVDYFKLYLDDLARYYGRLRWAFEQESGRRPQEIDRRLSALYAAREDFFEPNLVTSTIINREVGVMQDRSRALFFHDWEAAGIGDPVFDLAKVVWRWPALDSGKFLTVYQREAGIASDDRVRFRFYEAAHAFLDVISFAFEGRGNGVAPLLPQKISQGILEGRFQKRLHFLDGKLAALRKWSRAE